MESSIGAPSATAGLTARDLKRCIWCGKSYQGRAAKPRWAFGRDGHLVGTVHTYHENTEGRQYPYLTASGDTCPEAGRWEVWRIRVHGIPIKPTTTAEENQQWAFLLSGDCPRDELNAEQQQRLEWWLSGKPNPLGEDRRAAIMAAYRAMLAEFRAWRAQIPPDEPLPIGDQTDV